MEKAAFLRKQRQEREAKEAEKAAEVWKKMVRLQRAGWTFTEIARFLSLRRKAVVNELFYRTYRETGQ
jgi:hypothetical protein